MDAGQSDSHERYVLLRTAWSLLRLKVAGLAMVTVLLAVVLLALAMFTGRFQSTAVVTVDAPRSGLVLDPDAKVRMRGVEIGRVAAIEPAAGRVRLTLALDPELMRMVPENALVDIRSTTVFGAKYVNFVAPPQPSDRPLRAGALVRGESVTVEFNTLFQRLSTILSRIDPAELNATLSAIGQALHGRGETLGDLLARADAYLREMNPTLPALRADMAATAQVGHLYADTAPELLHTVDNATGTATTLTEHAAEFDEVLMNVTGLAQTAGTVLAENEGRLAESLGLLAPTTGLLNRYNPVFYCIVTGVASVLPQGEAIFGGNQPGAAFNTNFMLGGEPYSYPEDLPKVHATGGPSCAGITDRVPGSHADYVVTDTSEGAPFTPSTGIRWLDDPPRVFEIIFAGLPGVGRR
ncbi:MCE family protein [Nocardia farcinica]|uniref:Putative Mce family protein n=1 Tax=Nocardia farcinica (strain IFM 10152) TaxID=247156 RepID=Q5YWK4_NOCFA|nr:putative Mce family protein [Nocardia farcinica IFM 10152]